MKPVEDKIYHTMVLERKYMLTKYGISKRNQRGQNLWIWLLTDGLGYIEHTYNPILPVEPRDNKYQMSILRERLSTLVANTQN